MVYFLHEPKIADIMTSEICFFEDFSNKDDALAFCNARDISFLPSEKNSGYAYKKCDDETFECFRISEEQKIDPNLSVFDPIVKKKFSSHEVLFVYNKDVLVGVIHFSDYNKPPFYIYLYYMLLCLETGLRNFFLYHGKKGQDLVNSLSKRNYKFNIKKEVVDGCKKASADPECEEFQIFYLRDLIEYFLTDIFFKEKFSGNISSFRKYLEKENKKIQQIIEEEKQKETQKKGYKITFFELRNIIAHFKEGVKKNDKPFIYDSSSFIDFFDTAYNLYKYHDIFKDFKINPADCGLKKNSLVDSKSKNSKLSVNKWLFLDFSDFFPNTLTIVYTSNNRRKATKKKIYESLKDSVENFLKIYPSFKNYSLDASIVVYTSKKNMSRQDVDNIAKTILDVFKHDKKNKYSLGLFNDDSQIVRLLVHKKLKEEIEGSETYEICVSFRKHNPLLKMNLVDSSCIPNSSTGNVNCISSIFSKNFKDEDLKKKISVAICKLINYDKFLLSKDVHEIALTSKLSKYLSESFPEYDVDIEYNRITYNNTFDSKRIDNAIVKPDVIVHKRGKKENFLIFEVKKGSLNEEDYENDYNKLKEFTSNENYMYKYGIFLNFSEKNVDTIKIFKEGKELK